MKNLQKRGIVSLTVAIGLSFVFLLVFAAYYSPLYAGADCCIQCSDYCNCYGGCDSCVNTRWCNWGMDECDGATGTYCCVCRNPAA